MRSNDFAVTEQRVHHRAERRKADAAGHDADVLLARHVDRPARAERPAQPDHVSTLLLRKRAGDRPDAMDRVRDRAGHAGSELMEIAASPTPNTYSMLNWPGLKLNALPRSIRSSQSVNVSSFPR